MTKRMMQFFDTGGRIAIAPAMAFALVIGGCATPPSDPAARAEFEATNDPLEPLNRRTFDFNLFVDRILIKPIAQVYQAAIPEQGRTAIRHFLDNLGEPVVFANNLLQGEFHRADVTFGRFLFNSTFGLGGLMDPASSNGLEKQTGDLGQTLYSWGVPDGPYLVLPIFGPSNPRDAVGGVVEAYASPYSYISSNADWGRRLTSGVDLRARNITTLDDLQRNSLDFYTAVRSLARQRRASELRHGAPAPMPAPELEAPELDPPQ